MQYKITTKQGTNYIVDDNSAWLWISLERELGYTMPQAAQKLVEGSLEVITWLLHKAALDSKQTELKTHKTWVEHEFESFEVVEEDPKDSKTEA
jgi:hypothetical protein